MVHADLCILSGFIYRTVSGYAGGNASGSGITVCGWKYSSLLSAIRRWASVIGVCRRICTFLQGIERYDSGKQFKVWNQWDSISWDLDSNERLVKLHASYEIMLPVSFFGMRSVNVEQSASARKWNGYQSESSGNADSWVYVTPYGSVYHQSTAWRYLDLSVHAAGKNQIGVLRNKDGSIYYPCRSCHAAGAEGTVYVTDYGTNYHASRRLFEIKTGGIPYPKRAAEGKSPCKKCYEEKEQ